jgi:pimeloyl-ACP methyl ester carboxylesterase
MREITVQSGNANLAVSIDGEREPALVFLHAGVCDRRMWNAQFANFAAGHRIVAYDRRGFGATTYDAEAHNYVHDLDTVLTATVRGPAVLVGCSQGGRIAVDFALSYPARVAALVLVAPAISGAPEPKSYPPAIQDLIDASDAAERANDAERLNAIEAHTWLDGPAETEGRVQGAVRDLFLEMNGRALRAAPAGEETGKIKAYERFGELQMPIAFVLGALDFPHINERARTLKQRARRADLFEMAGTAHLPPLERPAAFNELLEARLAVWGMR